MSILYKYQVFCTTDSTIETTVQDLPPTVCPTNPAHTIDTNSIVAIKPILQKGTLQVSDGGGNNISFEPGDSLQPLISNSSATAGLQYVSPVPSNYIDGMTLNRNGNNVIRINAGTCRDSSDIANISLSDFTTADVSNSGAGGLDTGSEAADTWYAIYVIGDSSGTNPTEGLFSESTVPSLPSGYDVYRRVGWTRNDSGSMFYDWDQTGTGRTRRFYYDETFATVRVLNGGSAPTRTDVDLSEFAPPTASYVTLRVDFATGSSGSSSDFIRVMRKGFDTVGPVQLRPGNVSAQSTSWIIGVPCNNLQVIQYLVSDGTNNSASIAVVEFEDDI